MGEQHFNFLAQSAHSDISLRCRIWSLLRAERTSRCRLRLVGPPSPLLAAPTRAREAAPIPVRSDADRPAPAGSAALRLLADVDISL
jgi:hypothetical protein